MSSSTLTPQKEKRTIKSFFPIAEWLPKYQKSWLRFDAIAALTVWALLVPEAMAYAGIAGMPPETGLYAAPLALLAYAVFGSSRHLSVGPSSTVAILSFSVVSGMALAGTDEFITLTIMLAILTGIILVIGGLLRLGVLADFLSRPVLDGFIVGLAITIAVGQFDKILGFTTTGPDFIPEVLLFFKDLGMIQWPTFIVGMSSLILLFLMEKYIPKIPAAITVLFLAIIASYLLNFESYGVHIVGFIPAGLPSIGIPHGITIEDVWDLLPGAAAIALVGFSESIAAARSYATKFGYKISANQDLIALGMANGGSGISGGFVVDGSLSRSAASVESGGKSQMASILAAVFILITVVALTSLFFYLPEATLGAIVIHAVWHLISVRKIRKYWGITSVDFWTAVVAMLGVLFLGILQGLLLAIFLGLLLLLAGAKYRTTSILGKVPDESVYRSLDHFPAGETYPGLLILRFNGSLFFANAPNFADEMRAGVTLSDPRPQVVLIDSESINGIDATAVETIKELYDELERDSINMRFASVKTDIMDIMRRAGLEDVIGADHFYVSVQDGVDAYLAEPPASDKVQDEEQA